VGKDLCGGSPKCLTAGSAGLRVSASPMLRFIIHLKTRGNLRMFFLRTSSPKSLTKSEDGILAFLLILFY
jgi:hypothetical protein